MRPEEDLEERLARLLNVPLGEFRHICETWPSREHANCLPGPKFIWMKGKSNSGKRVVMQHVLSTVGEGDLHPTWRVVQNCHDHRCLHPWHLRLSSIAFGVNGVAGQPVPARNFIADVDFSADSMSIDEIVDCIREIDGWRDLDVVTLSKRIDCSTVEIAQALGQIRAEEDC